MLQGEAEWSQQKIGMVCLRLSLLIYNSLPHVLSTSCSNGLSYAKFPWRKYVVFFSNYFTMAGMRPSCVASTTLDIKS